jgi:hypothetical protein
MLKGAQTAQSHRRRTPGDGMRFAAARDVAVIDAKLRACQPRAIAFTGKMAASLWLRRRTDRIHYGH